MKHRSVLHRIVLIGCTVAWVAFALVAVMMALLYIFGGPLAGD